MYVRLLAVSPILVWYTLCITRLPCQRKTGFRTYAPNHQFIGNSLKDINNLASPADCATECLGHQTCSFFNYCLMEGWCQLFNSSLGYLESKANVSIYYATVLEKKCPATSCVFGVGGVFTICKETCEDTGFVCAPVQRIIVANNHITASSYYGTSFLPHNVNDQKYKYDDGTWISSAEDYVWLLIDFVTTYKVAVIRISNVPLQACNGECHKRLHSFNITIGNNQDEPEKNNLCVFMGNQVGIYGKNYECLSGPIEGRYFFLSSDRTNIIDPTFTDTHMSISEIRVFRDI